MSEAGAREGGNGMEGPVVVADLIGDAPEWQERALCSQTDPEAFFPEKGGSTREAKRICSRCEVRADCLEYALGHDLDSARKRWQFRPGMAKCVV